MRVGAHTTRADSRQATKGLPIAVTPLRSRCFVFLVGFAIQFNALVGGGDDSGAGAIGGYGYRLTDFIALGALALLGLFAIAPHRVLSFGAFGLLVAVLFLFPMLSSDLRTANLARHYVLYGFATLYVVLILRDLPAIDCFCTGLIAGVLATVPIFVLQDFGYTPALIEWGLTPGYFQITGVFTSDVLRLTGFWGHPNEAGHVAALSSAAAAYFAFVRHRFMPLVIVGGALLAIFSYTMSRGGLIAGATPLVLPLLFFRGRLEMWRIGVLAAAGAIVLIILSNVDSIAARFQDDPNASNNIGDRIDSILYGFRIMFTHPFGTSIADLFSLIYSGTGGVGSPHNGFLFFGAIFGLLPLTLFLVALAANLRVRDDTDIFFAVLTFQITLSFLFEILSDSYSYVFVICILLSRAFLKTQIGASLVAQTARRAGLKRRTIACSSGLRSS